MDLELTEPLPPPIAAARLAAELPEGLEPFGAAEVPRSAPSIDANVAGFVLKETPAAEVASAVRKVHAGERVVDPALAVSALREGEDPLTPREREVLRAARDHSTIGEVARRLYLSEGTVRNYLSSVIHKLGARNRAEAIAAAEQKGWL